MKKTLVVLGVILVSFIVGFIAIYFTVPMLAPERYVEAQHSVDSLRQVQSELDSKDSSRTAVTKPLSPKTPPTVTPTKSNTESPDSSSIESPNNSPTNDVVYGDSTMQHEIESQKATISLLLDSLRITNKRLDKAESEQIALHSNLDALNSRLSKLEGQRVSVKDLSATIPKLEDKDLSAVLSRLDLSIVSMLYTEATGKNRSRILQGLSSDRAALLVNYLIKKPDGNPSTSKGNGSSSNAITSTN